MKLYVRKLDDAHVTSFIKKGLNIPNGHPAAADNRQTMQSKIAVPLLLIYFKV
jgi:hypothetical protein